MQGDRIVAANGANQSVWSAAADARGPYVPAPELVGEIDCDVAIVGGGFTGVSAAFHLKKRFPERRIVLCEARRIGDGASGRNGGLVLNWTSGALSDDLELARRIFDTTRRGIDRIQAMIDELGLDVPFRRGGCLELFTDPRRADAGAREVERLVGAGIPLRFLAGPELARFARFQGAEGAILDPTSGQLDGLRLLRAMRPVIERMGVHVHEQSPVERIREGATHTLGLPRGRVRARALVLATNAYTPELGYFRANIVPIQSRVIATEPLTADVREEIGWGAPLLGFSDDRDRVGYGSLTDAGQIVFGGGSNAAYAYGFAPPGREAFAAIQGTLERYLPGLRERAIRVQHAWSGPVALTLDRLCSMGVRGEHRNVYFALGYSGHGITLANLAGEVLTDLYSGDDARWRGLPFIARSLPFVPPEPFRWLGYHVYTSLTGRTPRRK
jgi:glycine/D-amino acid oxidase-like deaminating enzyme